MDAEQDVTDAAPRPTTFAARVIRRDWESSGELPSFRLEILEVDGGLVEGEEAEFRGTGRTITGFNIRGRDVPAGTVVVVTGGAFEY